MGGGGGGGGGGGEGGAIALGGGGGGGGQGPLGPPLRPPIIIYIYILHAKIPHIQRHN